MEKILQQILEGQTKLVENIDKIVVRLDQLEEGQSRLSESITQLTEGQARQSESIAQLTEGQARQSESIAQLTEGQSRLSHGQAQLSEGQAQIIKRLDIVDNRLENIECKVGENTRFITALSQDVARTATQNAIATLDAKVDLLNNKVFHTEAAIALLKIVK